MKARLLKTAKALLHANVYSLLLFGALFTLLYLVGAGVPLSLIVSKVVSWGAFAGQLGLAAFRR